MTYIDLCNKILSIQMAKFSTKLDENGSPISHIADCECSLCQEEYELRKQLLLHKEHNLVQKEWVNLLQELVCASKSYND